MYPVKFGTSLSPRELEVLYCLSEGLCNPDIGKRLSISSPTVSTHLQSIYNKFGVSNRVEAVIKGIQKKLITVEEINHA